MRTIRNDIRPVVLRRLVPGIDLYVGATATAEADLRISNPKAEEAIADMEIERFVMSSEDWTIGDLSAPILQGPNGKGASGGLSIGG